VRRAQLGRTVIVKVLSCPPATCVHPALLPLIHCGRQIDGAPLYVMG
jgi:hypothetical protein